jgi:hypothetical protein
MRLRCNSSHQTNKKSEIQPVAMSVYSRLCEKKNEKKTFMYRRLGQPQKLRANEGPMLSQKSKGFDGGGM